MSEEIVKLTDWKNEPAVKDLKQNLDDADSDQFTHINNVNRWLSNLYVKGPAKPKKVKGQSSVAPKVIRKQAEWRYSALSEPFLSSPDLFKVSPTSAGDRERAQQNALVLNKQFNAQIDKVNFIDDYVRDAVDIGTVLVKVGWETEEEIIEEEVPVYQFIPSLAPEVFEQYQTLLEIQKTNPDLYADNSNPGLDKALEIFATSGQIVIPQQTGTEIRKRKVETKNQPTVEICIPQNIIIDPSCKGNLKKAKFIGEKFTTSLSDLRKDNRYKNLDYINVEAASPLASPDYEEGADNSTFNFTDKPRKQFVVHMYWGFWDKDESGIAKPIIAAWVNDTMIRLEDLPFPDRELPFVKAVYMPVRRSLYGEPDGELLEENQQIIGAITRGAIDLMGKSANGQTGFKKGLLDTTNKRKFRRGEDYEFNSNDDPRQGIYTHQYPEIPSSAYNMITMQNNDAESLTGVKAFHTGINGNSLGPNVGNGRSALDAASKREAAILRRLAAGIIAIGRKIISMNAEWLSEEEVIRITNEKFITVRRDDLSGKFDLELDISTPEQDEKKAEELAFMLQTDVNMDPEMRKMLLSDIARLRKMPSLAKRIEEFQPTPDPLLVAEQQLKIKLLEAQIAKELALGAKHAAEAGMNEVRSYKEGTQGDLNTAKISTEQAKSRELGSKSDRTDLDYLEQQAGVHQAREIEKINTKAQRDKEVQESKTPAKA